MSDNRVYVRKHKRKEQCCSVLVTPEKPTSRRRPELKEVYGRRTRMKPEEKVFESSSNENNIDCDKSSEIGFKTVSCVEKDVVFDPCMALSDKKELQSSGRTENSTLGSVGNLKVTLDPPGTADLKEPSFVPGLDLEVHSFEGIKNLCLESTVTSKEKELSFNGIEVITSGDGGSICLSKSICSLENDDSFNPTSMQTDEGGSTCLVSAGTIEGLNTLDQGFNDWDLVMNRSPFEDLSCLFGPKASQPYAMSQDNGFMRENVSYDQILANDCLGSKKGRQKPKRKIHRPKVARDGKPTTPKQARERKPKLATPNQAKEKKPRFATAKQAKEKKSKNAIKQTSLGLKDAIIETKNPPDFESSMVIEISETKAPVARALDFQFESLDARPVKFDSLGFPIKKRRSKRRRRLNWFALSVKSVRKIVKKRNLFTANWFPRKRRIRMKRPRKVTDIDAKTAEIHNQPDKTDLSAVREIDVLETYTLSALKEIEQLETDVLTAVREMELLDPDTHHNTDKMDLSALREIIVLETDSETAVRQIEVLKTDTSFTGKRKRKARTLKATVKPREFSKVHIGLDPGRREFSIEEELDSVIHRILSLDISGNTLVPYQSLDISGSTLVPYQGPFQPLKKIRPKVDLDVETVREWNLLVGIDVDRTKFGTSDDAKDQWEKDREVFAGRVASFIARLRPIQGDRSFRKWKGSVLDSTIGVILTQNVTDAYSSNAFMSVAAKFPPKPVTSESDPCCSQESVGSNMSESDPCCSHYFVTEPGPERDEELNKATDGLVGELEETRMNTGYKDCLQVISTSPNLDLYGSLVGELEETSMNTGYEGCLKVINDTNLPMSSTDNLNGACGSIVQSQYTKLPKGVRVKIPKVKERDYLNMGFGKRSTSEKKESASNEEEIDWESVRIKYSTGERSSDQMDAVDWEAVRLADVNELAACIVERGQHNILAMKIQNLLNRLVTKHNCLDLEFLRNTPPDLAKRYLLEVNGLGLKSVECIRLLSLEQVAFPVDVNVARIVVRLGWVPLKPLPEHLQLHLLEQYPLLDDIQIYLWPRLCKLPQRVLYELHYHMITFGKVTCTKSKPNCKACPMSGHCRHFQSQHASANKTLPSNTMKSSSASASASSRDASSAFSSTLEDIQLLDIESLPKICEPIIEEPFEAPPTPLTVSGEPEFEEAETEYDSDGIPIIKLNVKKLKENNLTFEDGKVPTALVTLHPKSVFSKAPKLKQNWRLRTEHMVYELPRNHILIQGLEQTNSDQDVQYHLAIWRPGEIGNSFEPSKKECNSTGSELCDEETCFSCNNIREQNANIVRGTLLIPCREANRSRFPLNGTYFQLNEVFADHETSYRPIVVPRDLIYNLRTKTLYCGTSISAILRGEPMEVVQKCFKPGIICIRGFDQSQRAPRPLAKRFHIQPSFKVEKLKKEPKVNAKKAMLQW
ncbi:hypothetical protein GQ457_07G035420 [Hibiscus cannabinus]